VVRATVLILAEEYARLKRRDRRIVLAGEFSEEQMAAIRKAKVPREFDPLDQEFQDWKQ
jgi:hypothetical protein